MTEREPDDILEMPNALRRAIAAMQGNDVSQIVKVLNPSIVFPVARAIYAAKKWRREHQQPGDDIEGEGIFLGQWRPYDRMGECLEKTFNVYAAPEDLKTESGDRIVLTFNDTVEYVAALKNWHGYNGTYCLADRALYSALRSGHYNGEWVIPTVDLLMGYDLHGEVVQTDNLYAHHGSGAFKDTYSIWSYKSYLNSFPDWYWSCSQPLRHEGYVIASTMARGFHDRREMNDYGHSCRLVRFVEMKG